jgi:hypothetical protein
MLPVLGAFKVFRVLKALKIFGDDEPASAVERVEPFEAERPPPPEHAPALSDSAASEPLEPDLGTF